MRHEASGRSRRWPRLALGLLLTLVLVSAATLGGWHLWVNRDHGLRAAPVSAEPYQREDLAGGIVHVQVRGEGYGLGYAEGRALGPEIRALVGYLRDDVLAGDHLGPVRRDVLLQRAWRLDPFIPRRFREELRGMSDACGVSYADLLLVNTFDDLLHVSGCSTAVVAGRGGGPLLHARNLDYHLPGLARTKVILDIETRGVRLRTVGFPGFLGVLTGMSSRGLALTSHTSISDRSGLGEPSGFLYRRMLEDGRSLDEAKALLEGARRTMGNNLALSDGPGNRSLALELDAREVVPRGMVDGRLFVTNHYWTAPLQAHQPPRFRQGGSWSVRRIHRLEGLLPPGVLGDPGKLQAAMAGVANDETIQSVVLEPRSGLAWIAKGLRAPVTDEGYVALPGWQPGP